jgi:DNA-binding transcriptional LysR family regulator
VNVTGVYGFDTRRLYLKHIPQTGCHADGAATARCMPAADAMWSDLWHKPHMEMHQVRYFLAMTRSLNFTRAAEECNVTQPSLTRAIQKLEEEFGGPLFRRERSRTHLTDLGREILPLFETAYEAAQAAKNLAREIGKAQVAPLTLGIANTIENDDLHVLLGEIGAHLPGFELTLQSGSSEEMIGLGLNGALDLFVVKRPKTRPTGSKPGRCSTMSII